MVRTSVTVTLNNDSMAARICGLVASGCTRNAYSLRAPYAADDFSVTTGPTIVWCSSGIGGLRRLGVTRSLAERRELDDHGVRPENLVRGRVHEPHHLQVRDVTAREVHVVRMRRPGREDEHLLVGDAELPERSEEHTSELQSRLHLVCRL